MHLKKKILKIENLVCLICEDKLSFILDGIKGIKKYSINVYTKEIFIVYDSSIISLQKIMKILSCSGFLLTRFSVIDRKYFIIFILLAIIKITIFYDLSELAYINLGITSILQIHNIVEIYRLFITSYMTNNNLILVSSFLCYFYGMVGYILDFEYKNECFLMVGLSSNILIYVYINKYIVEMIIEQSKISLFQIKEYRKLKIKKIEKNENSEIKVYQVDMKYIKKDDHIILKDDSLVLVDGYIYEGECIVDESNITGEQSFKRKYKNSLLYAGTFLKKGYIILKVTGVGRNTFVSKIYNCVNESNFQFLRSSNIKRYKYFTKFVIYLAIIVFFVYLALGFKDEIPSILTDNSENILIISFKMFISTIIISCPCVFLLSEPLLSLRLRNIMVKNGIIIKNFKNINISPSLIFFDKTGTLTRINPKILKYEIYENVHKEYNTDIYHEINNIGKELLLRIVKTLEIDHSHPLSYSFHKLLEEYKTIKIEESEYCPGKGIRCRYNKNEIRLGNYLFTNYKNKENYLGIKRKYLDENIVYVSINSKVVGYFLFEEFIESSCYRVIEELKRMNCKLIIISGDTIENVKNAADKLQIDTYFYGQTAKSKLDIIKQYKLDGYTTMMVGDGINDVPSFNIADISISLDFQNDMADIVMLKRDISKLPFIIRNLKLSKTKMIINYSISILYNSVSLPSVIGILIPYGIYVSIEHSCIYMFLSSCFIIVNSFAY